jgi:hypothetical protein
LETFILNDFLQRLSPDIVHCSLNAVEEQAHFSGEYRGFFIVRQQSLGHDTGKMVENEGLLNYVAVSVVQG